MLPRALPLLLATLAISASALARDTTAPPTRAENVVDTFHGTRVADPYRWLENGADPAVREWTASQSRRTRAYLDGLPVRARLRPRLESYISESSPRYYSLAAAGGQVFAAYFDPKRQQPMLRVLGADLDPAKARTVLDPNTHDPTGATAIDWFVPSPDGKLVAVSLSKGGSEDGTLHVFDTDSGARVGEVIPRVNFPTGGGDLAWNRDGRSFCTRAIPARSGRRRTATSTSRCTSTSSATIRRRTRACSAKDCPRSRKSSSTTPPLPTPCWSRCRTATAASSPTTFPGATDASCR